MYERESVVKEKYTPVLVGLGVGAVFMGVGLFAPEVGILQAGIFTPMIFFALVGALVFVAAVVGIFNELRKPKDATEYNGKTKIYVQNEPGMTSFIVMPIAFTGMGSLFAAVGIFAPDGIMQLGLQSEFVIFAIFGSVFAFIGLAMFPYAIRHAQADKIYKRLCSDPMSYTTDATYFEDTQINEMAEKLASLASMVQDTPLLYKYKDEMGVQRIAQTSDTYTKKEHEYFKNKGTFKIRCQGKYSVIISEYSEGDISNF